jgi:hypothetical protein
MPNLDENELELLNEIVLSGRGGGRKGRTPVTWDIVRELGARDVPALINPERVNGPALQVQMRSTHHLLAQCIAKGMDEGDCCLVTGYSPAYVSRLKTDPAFQELMSIYTAERKAIFVDVLERMKTLGLASMEEIQTRLENTPEKFTTRELMELTKMLLEPSVGTAKGGSGGTGGGVSVNVSFVTANHDPIPTLEIKGE